MVVAAGATMADVVKVTVYLSDGANFGAMNEVFMRFFPEGPVVYFDLCA